MNVRKIVTSIAIVAALIQGYPAAAAPIPSAITYQGQLKLDGAPLTGNVDLKFTLWNALVNGVPNLNSVTLLNQNVVNGLVNAQLDFGPAPFSGNNAYWMQVEVRSPAGAGSYLALAPRQSVTPTPYALYAVNSPGSTLDQAYDTGGAGAGRTINADSGAVAINGADGLTVQGGITTGPVRINKSTNDIDLQLTRGPFFGPGEPTTVNIGGLMNYGVTPQTASQHWAYLRVGSSAHSIVRNSGSDLRFNVEAAPNAQFLSTQMVLTDAGDLGLGTTAPVARLHINDSTDVSLAGGGAFVIGATTAGNIGFDGNEIMARDNGGPATLFLNHQNGTVAIGAAGTSGVGIGTSTPKQRLHVNGDYYGRGHLYLYAYEGDGSSGTAFVQARDDTNTTNIDLRLRSKAGATAVDVLTCKSNGRVGIGTTAPSQLLHVNGTARVNVLQITGGADLSENFDVRGEAVEPGMVVSIDPENPGRLQLATKSYDRTVAGVISGAGGVSTGMMMGHEGTTADGDHPVALTGRVYCYVDASLGAVKPGDLLTTSNTPGHAMRALDHQQAQGAILGKAMTSLESGKGLVLVLVSLQ